MECIEGGLYIYIEEWNIEEKIEGGLYRRIEYRRKYRIWYRIEKYIEERKKNTEGWKME